VPSLSPAELASALALVGVVIVIAALLSGLVERSGVPQVAIFLGLGAGLGPAGIGVLEVGLDSTALQIAATLSIALILFTDALSLDLREASEHRLLALLAVGPGTLLSAALFGWAAWAWLGLAPAAAAILGAALASTDPVLLKGLLRRPELPAAARHTLRLESGLNDVVLLPIVLVAITFVNRGAPEGGEWARLGMELLLLGPGAGVLVGLLGVATLDLVRRRIGVRRDYESLYSLGVAFAAYAAAESVHGSGYLAAFAAGFTIASFDVELCDCFREYGETTAELALLLSFVLLGSSLIWTGLDAATLPTLGYVAFVLFARPAIYFAAFASARTPLATSAWVAWFGPRGLSSLLLALLAVFAGVPEGAEIFRIACLVVLVSIALHGGTLIWVGRRSVARAAPGTTAPPPASPALAALHDLAPGDAERITVAEVQTLLAVGAPVRAIDVRRETDWLDGHERARGAVRISPERATPPEARAVGLPTDSWLVLYCECPNEETSLRATGELQRAGWSRARALVGGFAAWREAGLPVEQKPTA
jgi:sodium/hydrogen antiporter